METADGTVYDHDLGDPLVDQDSKRAPHLGPRTTRVLASSAKPQIFLTRNGIRRISVGNLLLRQRDQLLGDQDSTLDVLERYGCPSIKIPPCFAKRTRKQKS